MTQRIEPFCLVWLKELNPFVKVRLKELNFFFLSRNMTQRIEPLFLSRNTTQRIEPSFQQMTQRFWTFFQKVRLKELNLIFWKKKHDSKNWTLIFSNMTQWLEPLFCFKYNSKELKFFQKKYMTQRIEPFFSTWLKELNLFFFWPIYDSTN